MWKTNFLGKLIFDYAQIIKPIHEIIKMVVVYIWDKRENDLFSHIKQAITKSPALHSPDFSQYFFLYTFSSSTFLVVVLTQKYDQNNEWPIYFMRSSLQGPKLHYPTIEK